MSGKFVLSTAAIAALSTTAGLAYANVNNRLAYNSASGFSTFELPYYNVNSTRFGWVAGA